MRTIKVYGFTADKQLVETQLPLDEVVTLRIHPYWVDLFEMDPIVREINGRLLYFTRLRAISFAYWLHDVGYVVGMLDGERWTCIAGKAEDGWGELKIKDLRPLGGTFDVRFREYLVSDSKLARFTAGHRPRVQQGAIVWPKENYWSMDKPDASYQIVGHAFAGEMFTSVELYRSMPAQMAWVWQAFADWHPVIFGGSLRDLILGRPEHDVDFIVDTQKADEIKARLEKLSAKDVQNVTDTDRYGRVLEEPVFEFKRGKTKYHLVCRGNKLSDRVWELADFSVNQLRAERPEVVTASRIALWDLGHRQFRVVSRARLPQDRDLMCVWRARAERLAGYGFTTIRHEFADPQFRNVQVGWPEAQASSSEEE